MLGAAIEQALEALQIACVEVVMEQGHTGVRWIRPNNLK